MLCWRAVNHPHMHGNCNVLDMDHWRRGQLQTTWDNEQGLQPEISYSAGSLQAQPSPLLPQCKLVGLPASPMAACTCQSSTLTILKHQAPSVARVTLVSPPSHCIIPQEAFPPALPLYCDMANFRYLIFWSLCWFSWQRRSPMLAQKSHLPYL